MWRLAIAQRPRVLKFLRVRRVTSEGYGRRFDPYEEDIFAPIDEFPARSSGRFARAQAAQARAAPRAQVVGVERLKGDEVDERGGDIEEVGSKPSEVTQGSSEALRLGSKPPEVTERSAPVRLVRPGPPSRELGKESFGFLVLEAQHQVF